MSSVVYAGGIEYAGAGTQALGRGGAVAARADDPMVLMYNPAGLAELRGSQLMLGANLAFMNACVEPTGYYGWGAYGGGKPSRFVDPKNGRMLTLQLGRAGQIGPNEQSYYSSPYDTVCLRQGNTPVPEFGFTTRVSERLGIGAGLMFPAVTPQGQWGGPTGIIQGAAGLRPAATRYEEITSGTIGVFPTVGIGYRMTNWLRLGASFRWGIINVDNTSLAAVQVGTTPGNDILVRVQATDWFVPEFTGSVHVVPSDAIDIVGGFHYQADLNAPGTINLTTGLYDATGVPRPKTNQVTAVQQKFPWSAWGAIRYASRLAPRPSGTGHDDLSPDGTHRLHDAFEEERLDVELDVQYEMNARHRDLTIQYAPNQTVEFESTSGTVTMQAFPDPSLPVTSVQKRWRDQISVRLGGSYNVLPGLFGVSAGVHYENRGVDPSYMQVDYWPLQRVGLHAGARVRVAHNIDVMLAYAHIFQESLVVGAPTHENFDVIGMQYARTGVVSNVDKRVGVPTGSMPLTPLEEVKPASVDGQARLTQNFAKALPGTPPVIVNAGTYRSSMDIVSASLNVHF
jgi:long-subunit fatty acid transport protein